MMTGLVVMVALVSMRLAVITLVPMLSVLASMPSILFGRTGSAVL